MSYLGIAEQQIPAFPDFRTVQFSDKATIEKILRKFPPYSDFNFTSLWCWDIYEQRMVCHLHGNLVVMFTDYGTGEPFLSFLGEQKSNETVNALLGFCLANGLPPSLKLIPQTSAQNISVSELIVMEDRDNHDYVFSTKELSVLSGSALQSKRYKAGKFKKRNPSMQVVELDLGDKKNHATILRVIDIWEYNKRERSLEYEIDHELGAIKRLLATATSTMYFSLGIRIGDELAGFTIVELIQPDNSVLHFWKCNVQYAGIYDFLMQELAIRLNAIDIKHLNFEQDLGIEKLRMAKLAFRPIHYLKKYTISLAGQFS